MEGRVTKVDRPVIICQCSHSCCQVHTKALSVVLVALLSCDFRNFHSQPCSVISEFIARCVVLFCLNKQISPC